MRHITIAFALLAGVLTLSHAPAAMAVDPDSEEPEGMQEAPPPPRPPPQVSRPTKDLDAERWQKKDLSLLQGCWWLGHDAPGQRDNGRVIEECTTKTGTICFGADGTGQREQSMVCPVSGASHCRAPIVARFDNDGKLVTTQPSVQCSGSVPSRWVTTTLSCQRVSDTIADCVGTSLEGRFRPIRYEFRRAQ